VKLNVNKTTGISFCRKTNCHGFDYKMSESSFIRPDCIRDVGVLIDIILYLQIFSHAIGLLGLIRTVTFPFSSLHSLLTLHCTLVRPQLELYVIEFYIINQRDAHFLN